MKKYLLSFLFALSLPACAADYYTHGSFPATGASLTSAAFRAEFDSIQAGFAKLPTFAGNGSKICRVNAGATAIEAVALSSLGLAGTDIANTPAGSIAATNVQTALNELDTDKAPIASPTFTGTVTIPSGASIAGFAPLASPALTGTPTAPTAAASTNTTQIATTAFVTTADNLKANLASPTLTGTPAAPTASAGTNTTQIATTAFVTTADNLKANLASPALTGTPTAPTAASGTNTTQIATTAHVYAITGGAKISRGGGGLDNIGIGLGSSILPSNTTGVGNTVVHRGDNLLFSNTSGSYNAAYGTQLFFNTTGSYNSAFNSNALTQNTTGSYNSAFGNEALSANTTGSYSSAFGEFALRYATASGNVAFGYAAGENTSTGTGNSFFGGGGSGNSNTTGSNNLILGNGAQGATATSSNAVTLGNSSISVIRAQVTSITALSDARDKKDIQPNPYGLDFLMTLKPVRFTWNMRDGGKVGQKAIGFIAQDLKAAQEAVNGKEELNLVYEENPEKLEATYGNLVPVLVKSIQDLQAKVVALEARVP